MITAPIPHDEAERLADLRALRLLDTPPEERFDRLVELASAVFQVPISYVALVDSDRQWFKAKCGLVADQTGRDVSFCGHAILQDQPLVVPDASADERFRDNPLVVDEPGVRFYAGCPLRGPSGFKVGTFCIADTQPRELDDAELRRFRQFGEIAEHELQMADLIEVQHELLRTKSELSLTQHRLQNELSEADRYVQSLLPARLDGAIRTDWCFISSSELGGDLLGYNWLDDKRLAFYVLDVSGHGVGASLHSVTVYTVLRRQTLPNVQFDEPSQVLEALNQAFPMDEHSEKFFTLWYGVYDTTTRTLRYASGGHPPAIVVDPNSGRSVQLSVASFMVGAIPDVTYETDTYEMPPGARIYLFSDGVFDIGRDDFTLDSLANMLLEFSTGSGPRLSQVREQIQQLQGSAEFGDDFSMLEIEFP
ncbi:MAG TPA: SpoIIE family protein phosphatase [Thermoguttaceae bacterium]|nr:SpoIIE family protein phosphatase [Thermoguttaceae bacterium]